MTLGRIHLGFRNLSITAELTAIVVVFVAAILALVPIFAFSLHLAAGVRAYVGGEAMWSKGQKDAVFHLIRYARSQEERDYQRYERAIAYPLGDRAARLELEKPEFDVAVVEDGFVRGGIAREDVAAMIFLFRRFQSISYMRSAIEIWRAAEAQVLLLVECAEELREAVRTGRLDAKREQELLDRIDAINARVTPLEDAFSATLGDASRWVRSVLLSGIFGVVILLLSGGTAVAWRIGRRLRAAILELRAGAIRVAAGDLGRRIRVLSGGELGDLAMAFNEMIEQRRAAEDALRSATDFREKVMDNATDAIYVLDPQGRFTLVNRRTCAITGYASEELVGSSYARLIPEHRLADIAERFAGVVEGGDTVLNYETEVLRKDGRTITARFSNAPLRKGGKTVAVVGTAEDVTERNRAQQELDRTLALLRATLDATADGILAVDRDGKIVSRNRRFVDMWQLDDTSSATSCYESLVRGVLPKIRNPQAFLEDVRTLYGNPSAEATDLISFNDGRIFERYSRPETIGEEIVGRVCSFRDVTQEKRAEAEIRAARDEAIEASRARAEFLANMSHEIRTPMNAIIGLTSLLLDSNLSAEQRGFAQVAHTSAESLLALVNDILDFSKIDAGKLTIEPIPFDLEAAASETVAPMVMAAKAKNVDVTFRYDPTAVRQVVGDPGRIRQILTNLLSNAIKFTRAGQVVVDVAAEPVGANEARIRIAVADTGVGMDAEVQDRIFNKFVQADASTTRRYGGTGLGLAISKQLIQLMGGTIGVWSVLEQGSIFWFTLTLPVANEAKDAHVEPPPAVEAAPQVTAMPPSPSPARPTLQVVAAAPPIQANVLLVEDNPANQQVASLMLQKLGCRIDTAVNGKEAVTMVQAKAYDLVLMDCQMPEMDGYEATREIRRLEGEGRRVPIIAVTAHAMTGDRERCLSVGMDDYATKPIRKEALRAVLERWVPKPSPSKNGAGAAPGSAEVDAEFRENVRTWREEDGEQAANEIVSLFMRTTRDHISSLRTALGAHDLKEAKLLTHGLKGSCATFGAMKMSRLSKELEAAILAANEDRYSPLMGELEESFHTIEIAVANERICA